MHESEIEVQSDQRSFLSRRFASCVHRFAVLSQLIVCGSDQLDSLSYFGQCAHLLLTTSVIYFAYVFIFLVMNLYVE